METILRAKNQGWAIVLYSRNYGFLVHEILKSVNFNNQPLREYFDGIFTQGYMVCHNRT
jgi:hypothetical protein